MAENRIAHLFTLLCDGFFFFGGINIFFLQQQQAWFCPSPPPYSWYYSSFRGHGAPALRQLHWSCSMKQHRVDCGHLSVLGNHGHINKQQDIVSRWTATCRHWELFHLSFLLLYCLFSVFFLPCLFESGVRLVCDICWLITAVQKGDIW